MTLGKNRTPPTGSQEKQDIAEQSPIKMALSYCTIQSPLSLLSVSISPIYPLTPPPTQLSVYVLSQQAWG